LKNIDTNLITKLHLGEAENQTRLKTFLRHTQIWKLVDNVIS